MSIVDKANKWYARSGGGMTSKRRSTPDEYLKDQLTQKSSDEKINEQHAEEVRAELLRRRKMRRMK